MKPMANKKTIWITRTGVLLALLLALQWATLGTKAFAGQYITGSLVNCVLAVSALTAGLSSGLVIALLSPIFAYLLGIAPQLVVVPAIMAGNCALVLVLWAVGRGNAPLWRKAVAVVLAAVCKFVVLYLLVVQVICGVGAGFLLGQSFFGAPVLLQPMIQALPLTFSWPQLITALIGGTLGVLVSRILDRAKA